MKYVKPADQSDVNAPYVDANPGVGLDGSIVPADAVEHPQREIVYVITMAGLTPSEEDLTQLYQAIQNLIAAGGGGGGVGAYLPLAGGSMDANANINLLGSGIVKIAGQDVWHPGNDGAGSGLDADKLDGVEGAQFGRNDRDDEPMANAKVRLIRFVADNNSGILVVIGKDAQLGGGRLQFRSNAGAVNLEELLDDNRRTLRGKMWSDAGLTFEDQWRWLDTGELWLRKLNAAGIASGGVAQAIINLQGVTGDGNTGPLNGTGIGSYYLSIANAPGPPGGYPGTWVQRGMTENSGWVDGSQSWRGMLWQRVA